MLEASAGRYPPRNIVRKTHKLARSCERIFADAALHRPTQAGHFVGVKIWASAS